LGLLRIGAVHEARMRPVSVATRDELLKTLTARDRAGGRAEKGCILSESASVTG
jgi:hypothetical protein